MYYSMVDSTSENKAVGKVKGVVYGYDHAK
jgi:hypothetical protein